MTTMGSETVSYPTHPYGVAEGGAIAIDQTISAAGTTQATATEVVSEHTIVNTVAFNAGVRLQRLPGKRVVINRGANILSVYPATGGQIEAFGVNVAAGVATGGAATFLSTDGLTWVAI